MKKKSVDKTDKWRQMRNLPHMNEPNQQDWVCGQAMMQQE